MGAKSDKIKGEIEVIGQIFGRIRTVIDLMRFKRTVKFIALSDDMDKARLENAGPDTAFVLLPSKCLTAIQGRIKVKFPTEENLQINHRQIF